MKSRQITIRNKLGLHARAAAKLVNSASEFTAEVHLEKDGKRVNGKSIMGVMMLAASKGSTITVIADGKDEEVALQTLFELIRNRFGENE